MSTVNPISHIHEDDLALFAMQLLPESEMIATVDHIAGCEICRTNLAEIQGSLALLALTSEIHRPPPSAREHLLRAVGREKKFVPPVAATIQAASAQQDADAQQDAHHEPVLAQRSSKLFEVYSNDRAPRRSATAAIFSWSGWAIAAAAAVFAFLQVQERDRLQQNLATQQASLTEATSQAAHAQQVLQTLTAAGAMRVSLHVTVGPPVKPLPEARASYIASTGSLVLVASHLDQVASGKTYELWLLPSAKGLAPIPAGLFRPDASGNATVVLPDLPKGVDAKGFGVTIEADGGAKTPTAPIVLAGF